MKEQSSHCMLPFHIDGHSGSYVLKRSKQAKHIRFTVSPVAELIITIPATLPQTRLEAIIMTKRAWIIQHLHGSVAVCNFANGQLLTVNGADYRIELCYSSVPNATLKVVPGTMRVTLPRAVEQHVAQRQIALLLEAWYKKHAKLIIPQRVAELSQLLPFAYNRITIRDQKTRWGSCSQLGNLNFNWRLLLAPPEILDYVIIHELAHLGELNHSQHFWRLVESACSDYPVRRKWLQQNGHTLHW
ncbi:MAG: SprT family zinc-dependent metalloprotease [Peptococcaceae bacterium]|nr:SprT family zinc-dependent metalloprotease [Peptococcaceae bacterium]